MSLDKVVQALEQRLAAFTPAIAVVHENENYTPETDTPYMKANTLPADPDNSEMGSKNYFERGIFQVTLFYPIGAGAGDARATAVALREHFKRGTTMTAGGVDVIAVKDPAIARGFNDGDRYVLPISVTFQAHLSR